jgi:hypothetical protein
MQQSRSACCTFACRSRVQRALRARWNVIMRTAGEELKSPPKPGLPAPDHALPHDRSLHNHYATLCDLPPRPPPQGKKAAYMSYPHSQHILASCPAWRQTIAPSSNCGRWSARGSARSLSFVASFVRNFVDRRTPSLSDHRAGAGCARLAAYPRAGAGAFRCCATHGPHGGTATSGSRPVANQLPFHAIHFLQHGLI